MVSKNALRAAANARLMSAGATSLVLCNRRLPINFRYAPFATEIARRCNMSQWAISGSQRNVRFKPPLSLTKMLVS
jgi:hypothetical protein